VDRRSGYSFRTIEKKCFPHRQCWSHQMKGAATTVYCSNTSSGEHSISSRKKLRGKSSWSPEASIFRQ
jgi:hypothetical protein